MKFSFELRSGKKTYGFKTDGDISDNDVMTLYNVVSAMLLMSKKLIIKVRDRVGLTVISAEKDSGMYFPARPTYESDIITIDNISVCSSKIHYSEKDLPKIYSRMSAWTSMSFQEKMLLMILMYAIYPDSRINRDYLFSVKRLFVPQEVIKMIDLGLYELIRYHVELMSERSFLNDIVSELIKQSSENRSMFNRWFKKKHVHKVGAILFKIKGTKLSELYFRRLLEEETGKIIRGEKNEN